MRVVATKPISVLLYSENGEKMNFPRSKSNVIIIIQSVLLGFTVWLLCAFINRSYSWLGFLTSLICVLYLKERMRILQGEEPFWNNLISSDKIIYFLDLTILLTSATYVTMNRSMVFFDLLVFCAGLIFTLIITYLFGTQKLKEKIF